MPDKNQSKEKTDKSKRIVEGKGKVWLHTRIKEEREREVWFHTRIKEKDKSKRIVEGKGKVWLHTRIKERGKKKLTFFSLIKIIISLRKAMLHSHL